VKVLWDVDTQVDFMLPHGKLYVDGAEETIPAMKLLVDAARTAGIVHVAEVDDHELTDDEISDTPDYRTTYPPHCLHGTNGARKIPETSQVDPVLIPLEPLPERYLAGREFLLPKKTGRDRRLRCRHRRLRRRCDQGLSGPRPRSALRGGRRSRLGRGARGDLHSLVAQAGSRIHVRCGGRRELLG
jgi:hypothetical protein